MPACLISVINIVVILLFGIVAYYFVQRGGKRSSSKHYQPNLAITGGLSANLDDRDEHSRAPPRSQVLQTEFGWAIP